MSDLGNSAVRKKRLWYEPVDSKQLACQPVQTFPFLVHDNIQYLLLEAWCFCKWTCLCDSGICNNQLVNKWLLIFSSSYLCSHLYGPSKRSKMPRTLMFEESNTIFVLRSLETGKIKWFIEHNKRIFLHENNKYPKCNCKLSAQNCICLDLDLVIRSVDGRPYELLTVSG